MIAKHTKRKPTKRLVRQDQPAPSLDHLLVILQDIVEKLDVIAKSLRLMNARPR